MNRPRYREQYSTCSTTARPGVAGLDIVTTATAAFDADVAGHNWFSYDAAHEPAFSALRSTSPGLQSGFPHTGPHPHDVLETRMMPDLTGRSARHRAVHRGVEGRAAPDDQAVKFGRSGRAHRHGVRDCTTRSEEAILAHQRRAERGVHELAEPAASDPDGEPQIHWLARRVWSTRPQSGLHGRGLNTRCAGCAATGSVPHLLGNPAAQRLFAPDADYKAAIEPLSASTPNSSPSRPAAPRHDLEAIGKGIKDKNLHRRWSTPHLRRTPTGAPRGEEGARGTFASGLISARLGMGREHEPAHAFYQDGVDLRGTDTWCGERSCWRQPASPATRFFHGGGGE